MPPEEPNISTALPVTLALFVAGVVVALSMRAPQHTLAAVTIAARCLIAALALCSVGLARGLIGHVPLPAILVLEFVMLVGALVPDRSRILGLFLPVAVALVSLTLCNFAFGLVPGLGILLNFSYLVLLARLGVRSVARMAWPPAGDVDDPPSPRRLL